MKNKKARLSFSILLLSAFAMFFALVVIITVFAGGRSSENSNEGEQINASAQDIGDGSNHHGRESTIDDHIILAGFLLRPTFTNEVMDFNRRNPERQIVIRDYVRDYWDEYDNFGIRQGIERFHLDIIAGNVPDIILFEHPEDPGMERARDALIRQGVLLDLYPLIDADPDLSREDFYINALQGFEDADGGLAAIGNWLTITTMIATDPAMQASNWRFDDFLNMM